MLFWKEIMKVASSFTLLSGSSSCSTEATLKVNTETGYNMAEPRLVTPSDKSSSH